MFELLSLQTGVIFILLLVGYVCRRFNVYDAVAQKAFSTLILTVALPCKLVSSATLAIENVELSQIRTFYISCFSYFILGLILFTALARVTRLDNLKKKQFGILAIFPASAFIGMPFASALYGEKGVFFMGMFSICYSIIQYTYGIGIYTGVRKENLRNLLLNPLLMASCSMITLFFFQIKLPAVIQLTLSTIGQISTPLSMFVVGGLVSEQPLKRIFLERSCYLVSFSRLVLIPIITISAFHYFGVESFLAIILAVTFSLPCSSTSAVIASKYDGESTFCSTAVAQSMVFFVLTIPCVIYVLNKFWVY